MHKTILLLIMLVVTSLSFQAQERYTENTLKLSAGNESPASKIGDMAWLAGHWTGEAMGGLSEEIWSAPKSGAMMGMYRFINKDKIIFYELMTIVEEKGSLVLRLKHFNPDLKGWEEKDKTTDFRFVSKKDKAIYFEGITFKPETDKSVNIYLATRHKDGTVSEEVFHYTRVSPVKK
jgi:hypothetical protein